MADPAHEAADRAVDEVMAEVRETYLQAQMDAQEALSTYLASFEREDAAKLKLVESGELSERDYRSWRASKVLTGKRYASLLDQVSWGYEHANEVAMAALEGRLPEVYAENANFAAYSVCEATGAAIPFDMMSADAVQQMVANGADLFPVPSVNAAKDVAWSRKLMASQLTQGLLLGESMPKVARRIQSVTDSNWATALRTARTTVTAAENAGRVESYRRAKDMGIQLKKQWMATLDGRTRHSHRQLDGEAVAEDEKFSNGCRYPGDPEARYAETMNCRCTLIAAVEGFEHDLSDLTQRWGKLPEGMTYEQWKGEGLRAKEAASPLSPSALSEKYGSVKPYDTVSRKQAGLLYRAHKDGRLGATENQVNMMYGRYVADGAQRPSADARANGVANKLRTAVGAAAGGSSEEAAAAWQHFLDAHYAAYDDSLFPDDRTAEGAAAIARRKAEEAAKKSKTRSRKRGKAKDDGEERVEVWKLAEERGIPYEDAGDGIIYINGKKYMKNFKAKRSTAF